MSVLSGCRYVRGLLFKTASTSAKIVVISSKFNLDSFKVFFKHRLVERIKRSKRPPTMGL